LFLGGTITLFGIGSLLSNLSSWKKKSYTEQKTFFLEKFHVDIEDENDIYNHYFSHFFDFERSKQIPFKLQRELKKNGSWKLYQKYMNSVQKDLRKLPIRLIFMNGSVVGQWLNERINLESPWGRFHAALQIGPYIVDWHSGEFCLPRPFVSEKAIVSLTITEISLEDEETLMKISSEIADWNKNYKYSFLSRNCQHFIIRLLNIFKIDSYPWKEDGFINEKLTQLKELYRDEDLENFIQLNIPHEQFDELFDQAINRNGVDLEEIEWYYSIDRCFVLRKDERKRSCPYAKKYPESILMNFHNTNEEKVKSFYL